MQKYPLVSQAIVLANTEMLSTLAEALELFEWYEDTFGEYDQKAYTMKDMTAELHQIKLEHDLPSWEGSIHAFNEMLGLGLDLKESRAIDDSLIKYAGE